VLGGGEVKITSLEMNSRRHGTMENPYLLFSAGTDFFAYIYRCDLFASEKAFIFRYSTVRQMPSRSAALPI
jgi:hypothetical protein